VIYYGLLVLPVPLEIFGKWLQVRLERYQYHDILVTLTLCLSSFLHHRKIHGLVSYESDEVYKLKERPHDRRLVQAVIGKNSCLVGKTPTDVKFRTRYGAAVIAINRGGRRLHQHPGKVQLRGEREIFSTTNVICLSKD
jgi:K+/H+ antiporter YhaU regulatory subunit KhtT